MQKNRVNIRTGLDIFEQDLRTLKVFFFQCPYKKDKNIWVVFNWLGVTIKPLLKILILQSNCLYGFLLNVKKPPYQGILIVIKKCVHKFFLTSTICLVSNALFQFLCLPKFDLGKHKNSWTEQGEHSYIGQRNQEY